MNDTAPEGQPEADAARRPEGLPEADAVERDHLGAWHETQRSWGGVAIVLVVMGGIFALHLIPEVRAFLGNSLLEIGLACAVVAFIALLGALLFNVLGVGSSAYLLYDQIESAAVQVVLNGLVFTSHHPVSPAWAFWMLHTCLSGTSNFSRRAAAVLSLFYFGLPLAQGAVHLAAGDVPAAALTVVMTLAGAMGFTYGLGFMKRVRALEADRLRLLDELGRGRLAEDRRRIARDLHDGLGADLAAIAWRSAALAQRPGSEALAADLTALTGRATAGIDEIRSVVWATGSESQTWADVVAYLRGRAHELAPAERVRLDAEGEGMTTLAGTRTSHLLRFVLEAMRNAVAHGEGPIAVRLALGPELVVTIDNALGDRPVGVVGSGLRNLEARAAALGGAVEIGPRAGRFVVSLRAPSA